MEKAKIYTYSILYSSTEEFKDRTPYLTTILEKESGERFAALVDGWKEGMEVKIGQEVHSTGPDADGKQHYSL